MLKPLSPSEIFTSLFVRSFLFLLAIDFPPDFLNRVQALKPQYDDGRFLWVTLRGTDAISMGPLSQRVLKAEAETEAEALTQGRGKRRRQDDSCDTLSWSRMTALCLSRGLND